MEINFSDDLFDQILANLIEINRILDELLKKNGK